MADIIPFARPAPKEPSDPHYSGEAHCLACGHDWMAVAKVGTPASMPGPDRATLTCPACSASRGVLKYHVIYSSAKFVYSCTSCGCTLFSIVLSANGDPCTACAGCGQFRNALDIFDACR